MSSLKGPILLCDSFEGNEAPQDVACIKAEAWEQESKEKSEVAGWNWNDSASLKIDSSHSRLSHEHFKAADTSSVYLETGDTIKEFFFKENSKAEEDEDQKIKYEAIMNRHKTLEMKIESLDQGKRQDASLRDISGSVIFDGGEKKQNLEVVKLEVEPDVYIPYTDSDHSESVRRTDLSCEDQHNLPILPEQEGDQTIGEVLRLEVEPDVYIPGTVDSDEPVPVKRGEEKDIDPGSSSESNSNENNDIRSTKKRLSCEFCSFETSRRDHLVTHRRKHTGEKPFKCDLCPYSAVQKVHLNLHIRTHTGEKPYGCPYCSYKASQKYCLSRHLRRHTGEKSFQCLYCPYKASQQANLTSHLRTHTGEKSFKCEYCSYAASHKAHLTAHLRTHSGERLFKCIFCSSSFSTKGNLVRHHRTHNGEEPSNIST